MAACDPRPLGPLRLGLPMSPTPPCSTACVKAGIGWLGWWGRRSGRCAQSEPGPLIRIVDATNVLKAGAAAKTKNKLWRIHSAFDLPSERFGFFELTDEHGGERLDRAPVIKGEIRLGDRVDMQPDRIAALLEAGADIVVRSGWRNARWLDADGARSTCSRRLRKRRQAGCIDCPIWIGRKSGPALALRLVARQKVARGRGSGSPDGAASREEGGKRHLGRNADRRRLGDPRNVFACPLIFQQTISLPYTA